MLCNGRVARLSASQPTGNQMSSIHPASPKIGPERSILGPTTILSVFLDPCGTPVSDLVKNYLRTTCSAAIIKNKLPPCDINGNTLV